MALTLVTGPANAGKARRVLDGVCAQLDAEPVLVVPTGQDAEAYRRELAGRGAVFGARVETFDGLAAEMARRAGTDEQALGTAQRERLVEAAVAGARLEALAASAGSPGFAAAAGALIAELQRELVEPARFEAAIRRWGRAHGRERYAAEIASVYSGYRALLDRLRRVDSELLAWRALDALGSDPTRWGATPIFLYGFDDLTTLERRAVETLARADGVEVTVALTWEDRPALAGRARTFEALRPLATRHEALEAGPGYYAAPALHHLERGLFGDAEPVGSPAGEPVRLLEAGGERAELELVAAEVISLLREGVPPEEVAVVFRSPRGPAPLVRSVFSAYGISAHVAAPVPLAHTPLGRGLLGLARCALDSGTPEDLLAWLRTPGVLDRPELADSFEGELRRAAASSADEALALWEERHWPLEVVARLRASAGRGLLDAVAAEAQRLLAAPRRRMAAVLDDDERLDAAALRVVLDALGGLAALARDEPALAPSPPELVAALDRLEVRPEPSPAAVQVLDPLAIRARRVRALFACGLQEGEFPRPPAPEPFLPDEVRRALARAPERVSLRPREDVLNDERALFYAVASRPEAVLGLSYRTSDEEGRPAVRSFFVDDVRDLFTDRVDGARRTRPLAAVTWPAAAAPTARELARARAADGPRLQPAGIAPLRAPAILADLASREAWSAAHLESFAGCPVQWLVDRYLHPDAFEPESEPLARGNAAHLLLERTLRRLRKEAGSARLDEHSLPRARALLAEEVAAAEPGLRLSADPARSRSVLRRLQADLLRYLRTAARRPTALEPDRFELGFGGPEDDLPALALDGLRVRGRIDRIDADDRGRAAVYDYKGSQAYGVDTWRRQGRLQVALYMLAVRDLLGLDPVAGFYQATSAKQPMRGVVRDDMALAEHAVRTDCRSREEMEAVLADAAARAEDVARAIASGEIEARPDSCGWENRCQYPGVCRCEH